MGATGGSCALALTYGLFEQPKLLYQEIQFHPAFGFDGAGYLTNNKGFLLSSADSYLLAVLNSPLMWWYNWRYLPHMKDEALSPKGELMEVLPIAPAPDAIRAEVEPAVQRLIALTTAQREIIGRVLDWLRVEFDVETPGQQLEALSTLEKDEFVREVGRRRSAFCWPPVACRCPDALQGPWRKHPYSEGQRS